MSRRSKLVLALAGLAALIAAFILLRGGPARRAAPVGAASTGTPGRPGGAAAGSAARDRVDDPRTLPRASIAGTVTDAPGGALAGATVCAWYEDRALAHEDTRRPTCTTTGPDGGYRLDGLPAGAWAIEASAPERQALRWQGPPPDEVGSVRVAAGEARTGIDLRLEGGAVRVDGRVADIGGGPVEGAHVEVSPAGGFGRWGRGRAIARSAADGTFTVWVRPGTIAGSAEADGYADGESQGVAPTAQLEILLVPESALAGIVVEAGTGRPVPGAHVVVASDWRDGDGGSAGSARTDEAGRFRITRLAPGRYKPTATARGRYGEPAESVMLGLGESAEDLRIEVHPVASVSGTILVDDGGATPRPCPPEACVLRLVGKRGEGEHNDATAAAGEVTIEAALAGSYTVAIYSQAYQPEDLYPDVVVADQPLTGLTWTVRVGGTLVGTVRDRAGAPVAGVQILSTSVGGDARAQQTYRGDQTRPDGSYRLRGLPAGDYELRLESDRHPAPDPKPRATVTTGETRLDVVLDAGGALAGTVVDGAGRGVRGAHIYLQGKKWGERDGRSGDDGRFRLEGVTPDDYRVMAWREATGMMRKPGSTDDDVQGERVKVVAGETAQVRLVVESQDGVITGSVATSAGAPVPDAYLVAERESDAAGAVAGNTAQQTRWSWDRRPVVTDPDGAFRITELSPGTYTLRAYRRGGGEAIAEHVAVGGVARLVLRTTGSIAGQVTGAVPELITVRLADEVSGFARNEDFFRTGGRFTLRELPAGTYVVRATAPGAEGSTTVTLAEGQALTGLSIALAGKVTLRGRVVDLRDGTPVAGLSMSVAPTTAVSNGNFTMTMDGGAEGKARITGPDGGFVITDAPTGAVTITGFAMDWERSAYGFLQIPMQVAGAGEVNLGDLKAVKRRVGANETGGDLGFGLKEAAPGTRPEQRVLEVSTLRPGGPAVGSGLQVGDVIVTTDGVDLRGASAYLAWSLWTVPVGTEVELGLARGATVKITAGAQP